MNEFNLNVDPTNPGQFFACCGLFELADRLYGDVQVSFSESLDSARMNERESAGGVDALSFKADEFLADLAAISVNNTMTNEQLGRLETLKNTPTKETTSSEKAEKKRLESLWRDSPIVLGKPLNLRLDWFHDSRSGGSRFKDLGRSTIGHRHCP